jgi:basic membrane protein A and related proteins
MKKILVFVLLVALLSVSFIGCAAKEEPAAVAEEPAPAEEAAEEVVEEPVELLKVGMVTDAGTIDDKSFNQGTWEGILAYEEKGTIEAKYLQPEGTEHAQYVAAISDLVDAGYQVIVTPGFLFETAVNEAAEKFPDVSFILIDGMTHAGDWAYNAWPNAISIFFKEEQSGFMAGVAAALESKTGKLGFVGGMSVPAVVAFGEGFKYGVEYSNANLGTSCELKEDNYVYSGSFSDVDLGKSLAAGMFDKGVDIVFAAAGGVGVGSFNECKERAINGEEVMMVGVDVDQYAFGLYDDTNSVTLTSAMKGLDVAVQKYIADTEAGAFVGGEIVSLGVADDAVGLPADNPNLSADTMAAVDTVRGLLLDGTITLDRDPATGGITAAY